VVNVYKDYSSENHELVTSWRSTICKSVPGSRVKPTIYSEWIQEAGLFVSVSSTVPKVYMWDLDKEMCVQVNECDDLISFVGAHNETVFWGSRAGTVHHFDIRSGKVSR
jgi:hypothetical protein